MHACCLHLLVGWRTVVPPNELTRLNGRRPWICGASQEHKANATLLEVLKGSMTMQSVCGDGVEAHSFQTEFVQVLESRLQLGSVTRVSRGGALDATRLHAESTKQQRFSQPPTSGSATWRHHASLGRFLQRACSFLKSQMGVSEHRGP